MRLTPGGLRRWVHGGDGRRLYRSQFVHVVERGGRHGSCQGTVELLLELGKLTGKISLKPALCRYFVGRRVARRHHGLGS